MYCTHCGAKIDDNARFCPECGKSVAGEPAPQRELAPLRQPSSSQPRVPEYTPEPTSTRRKNTSFKKPQFKKEGSGEGSKVFFKILAAAIVVLVAYLGYDYFANGVGGGDEVVKKTSKPYFHLNEEEESYAGNRSLVAPSDLSLISYFPTRNEIEAVEPIQVEVSSEHPICRIGDITVEFSPFEFDEFAQPDTFQLRQLGTRHDDASGRDLTLFDFSLKSGKHQFSSNVYVTLPRPANGNGVLYYNESTKSWEPTVYTISKDLKNYVLLTNHFSLDAISADMSTPSIGIAGGTEIVTQTEQEIADQYNTGFYYINPKALDKKKILTQSIGINSDRFKKQMEPACVFKALTSDYLTSEDKKALEDELAMFELFSTMGFLDNINTYTGKYGTITAILKESGLIEFPSIPDEILSNLGDIHFGYRLFNSMSREDTDETIKIAKDYAKEIIKSIRDDLAKGNLVAMVLSAFWDYFGEEIFVGAIAAEEYAPKDDFEFFYHRFMQKGIDMGEYGRLTLNGSGWEKAIRTIIDKTISRGGDMKQVAPQIDALYRDFLNRYFEVTENERQTNYTDYFENEHKVWYNVQKTFNSKAVESRPQDFAPRVYKSVNSFLPEYIESCKRRAHEKVMYYSEKEVSKALKEMPSTLCNQLEQTYKEKMLPNLNTVLNFRVKNKRLLNGTTFDKSPYNIKGNIKFVSATPFKQIPIGTKMSDFSEDVLTPFAEDENSNIVFSCSRYYYMQMGCPTRIVFSGNGELKPVTIKFSAPIATATSIDVDLTFEEEEENQPKVEENDSNEEVVIPSEFIGNWIFKIRDEVREKLIVSGNHVTFMKYDKKSYYNNNDVTDTSKEPMVWITIFDSDVKVDEYRKGKKVYLKPTSHPYTRTKNTKVSEVELFFTEEKELMVNGSSFDSHMLNRN